MVFCPKCGKQCGDEDNFCSVCGHNFGNVKDAVSGENNGAVVEVGGYNTQCNDGGRRNGRKRQKECDRELEPVFGTWGFFGMIFVYSLPVIGLIVSIVLSIVSSNRNLRNYSRATMVWHIISTVISILLTVALVALIVWFTGEVVGSFADMFADMADMYDSFTYYS